ncbi:hypothetical protein R6Q57_009651 [Mikania cordata]
MFDELRMSHGIETKIKKKKTFIHGKGNINLFTDGINHKVKDVFFTPSLKRNLLSMNMLVNQGFEITFQGASCITSKVSLSNEENRTRVDEKGHGKDPKEVPTGNLNEIDKLSETDIMLKYFEDMDLDGQKTTRMMNNGKGKEAVEGTEPLEVNTIEKMVLFLDLLATVNKSLLKEEYIKIRFNKMVKWFNKYVIKKGDFWVPIMEEGEIDLYHLCMSVQLNGGKDKVTKNEFWPLIATDMGMNSRKGFELVLQYDEHLKMMHWYYTNLKKRQEEPCLFTIEEGQSSTNEAISKECSKRTKREEDGHLPYKKRRVSAVRSWPPGCGPATMKK